MHAETAVQNDPRVMNFVLIPYMDNSSDVALCLKSLLPELEEDFEAVVIDDGSRLAADDDPQLDAFKNSPKVTFIRHKTNLGPSSARNTGLAWCREKGGEIVILLDSDCEAQPGFIKAHKRLHADHPDVVCIGGAIQGQGEGIWANFDRLMSWFTSIPDSPQRLVGEPLHLPTTNMSLKLQRLPSAHEVFDPAFKTGEDVAFNKGLRKRGDLILFSPEPLIVHHDREAFSSFFRHQYRWGLHTYVVRFTLKGLSWKRRALFAPTFALGLPFYALLATWLNITPWIKRSLGNVIYFPVLFIFYLIKGVAVIDGALHPSKAFNVKLRQMH